MKNSVEGWPYKNHSPFIVCVLTTYVAFGLNGVEITRVEIFNKIRLLYLQEGITIKNLCVTVKLKLK